MVIVFKPGAAGNELEKIKKNLEEKGISVSVTVERTKLYLD